MITDWGIKRGDKASKFGCDNLVSGINSQWFRAVDVNAPAELVYKWVCHMKVAPYSYDKIDNGGKVSPQDLIPGIENLKKNEKMMTIFNIESFTPQRQINLTMDIPPKEWAKWYVPSAISYRIDKLSKSKSRIVVKYVAAWPHTIRGWFERYFIALADFIMMRRQLLNFRKLAERDYRRGLA